MTAATLSLEEANKKLHLGIIAECQRRARLRHAITPLPSDDDTTKVEKTKLLYLHLDAWAKDPVLFVKDNAWVPDRQKRFGADQIPPGLSPKGMMPFLMTEKQKAMILMWHAAIDAPNRCDTAVDKTRQFAATSLFLWSVALHGFLFRAQTTGLLGSYADDVIDKGGKGQRDDTSLFGRLRMFLDAFMWNFARPVGRHLVSHVAFAPPKRKRGKIAEENLAGMSDSEDVSYKLTRPRWFIEGIGVVFPSAEGNWLQGARPGDAFGRSYTATWALMDEAGHYPGYIKAGADVEAWAATSQNVRSRHLIGTPPRGGGAATKLYELVHDTSTDRAFLKSMHADWCDLPFYMIGAWWECRACQHRNPLSPKESPADGHIAKTCQLCKTENRLTRFTITSPWMEENKARYGNDKAGLAAEVLRDWANTYEERFFYTLPADPIAILPCPSQVQMYEGFDPGHSTTYPAAYLAVAFDPKEATPRVVGYYMASNTLIEWWVPFMKRWSIDQLNRMAIPRGMMAGKDGRLWREVFDYPDEALTMLRHLSKYPLARHGDIYGDTSGSKRMMTRSPYEILGDYGVTVSHRYTADRGHLVRKGVEWAARLEIAPEIADLKPVSPDGTVCPSVLEVFRTAKSVPVAQSERVDVDAKDPKYVKNAADAWFYLCRGLPDEVRAVVNPMGQWAIEEYAEEQPVIWGEGT